MNDHTIPWIYVMDHNPPFAILTVFHVFIDKIDRQYALEVSRSIAC